MIRPEIDAVKEAVRLADRAIVRAMSSFNKWMTWTTTVDSDQLMKYITWQDKRGSMQFLSDVNQLVSSELDKMRSAQSAIQGVIDAIQVLIQVLLTTLHVGSDEYQAWSRVRELANDTDTFLRLGLDIWEQLNKVTENAVNTWEPASASDKLVYCARPRKSWKVEKWQEAIQATRISNNIQNHVNNMQTRIKNIKNMANEFSCIGVSKHWSLADGVYGWARIKVAFFDLEVEKSIHPDPQLPESANTSKQKAIVSIQEMISTADEAVLRAIGFFREWLGHADFMSKISWKEREENLTSLMGVREFLLDWNRAMFFAQDAIHDIVKAIDKKIDALPLTVEDEKDKDKFRLWADVKVLAKITYLLWHEGLLEVKALATVVTNMEANRNQFTSEDMEILPMNNQTINEMINEINKLAAKMTSQARYRSLHPLDGGIYGLAQLRAELASLKAKGVDGASSS
jgi:archaellum component FlaC